MFCFEFWRDKFKINKSWVSSRPKIQHCQHTKCIYISSHHAAWERYVDVWWASCGVIKAVDGPAFEKNISRHFRPRNKRETWKAYQAEFLIWVSKHSFGHHLPFYCVEICDTWDGDKLIGKKEWGTTNFGQTISEAIEETILMMDCEFCDHTNLKALLNG